MKQVRSFGFNDKRRFILKKKQKKKSKAQLVIVFI